MYGFDINYDPDFEIIKEEISKSKNIDYKLVEEKAFYIVKQKCKDVRVFSYLALCYLKNDNWTCFCDIFEALSKLCIDGFDYLYPLRLEAKRLAFKWLDESRFIETLQIAEIPISVIEDIKRLIGALGILKNVLEMKFHDITPFPLRLYSFVGNWIKLSEQKDVVAGQTKFQTDIKSVIQSATDADFVKKDLIIVSSVSREDKPKEIVDAIRKNAMLLIEKEPETPIGYRLLRTVRWGGIEMMPVAESDVTKIEPPEQQKFFFLMSLMEKKEFKTALAQAEKTFSSGNTIFWLDLQRISAMAAGNIGGKYCQIKDAIIIETAVFLKRYPSIRNQKFVDNTPFCSSVTDEWLDREVIPVFCDEEKSHVNKSELIKSEEKDVFEHIASNNFDAALELLINKRNQCGSEIEKFKQMLIIASYMLTVKRTDISIFILESLYEKAENYNLLKWDIFLAVELYELLIQAYDIMMKSKQQNAKDEIIVKRNDVMRKICYLNPKKAFKIKTIDER